ncbi:Ubiquinone biosynthesis hydroxylase, UbiH/UbiF/VisC/COQ6 family [Variovorax sp. HW608]|uniref:5-demethoxyubiquinol-8 5-hydroxylase UbiM n=1 Tax=Variovorax sp. HW608 TaxID=1034889 RepID=UPI00081F8D95|nr:5-demethoxyubiquinol-8 5-hydroxylase UbiM [Variovorax sp. HW608]SCK06325.1 Ubiquinone biosynthesis hydroxylase, UbiH/UbiF/VisC/COQ6 family [Variovorax sp. HW608]
MPLDAEVVIVGAGPAGLAMAIALADAHFSVTVIDLQPRAALAAPAEDGREIALTHSSVETLRTLGLWSRLRPGEIGRIREARVIDGDRHDAALQFRSQGALGWIVPNHALRRVSFEAACERAGVRLQDAVRLVQVATAPSHVDLAVEHVADGSREALRAQLFVAADSRFSWARRQIGIAADMHEFGRTMIVCRMRHALPHHDVAHECFGYERTLAVLPLAGEMCSAVLTTDTASATRLMALPAAEYAALVETQFGGRLGPMHLVGERFAYPLVTVLSRRFTAMRSALIGDAAVGMHPVTAHGYNLGLQGVAALTRILREARDQGRDIGDAAVLAGYERAHRRDAVVMYHGTNAVAKLYAGQGAVQRLARQWVLRGAQNLPFLKTAIMARLTGRGGLQPPVSLRLGDPTQRR